MTTTLTIKELRNKLKPLGFNVKTKSLSFGMVGSVVRISDGAVLPEMFMNQEHLQQWKPAIDAITNILVVNDYTDRVSGPWTNLRG